MSSRHAICTTVLAATAALALPTHGAAQSSIDASGLETERPAMRTLLEKTIFNVDVAWLDIWFTPDVAERLRTIDAEESAAPRDSIAALATRATDVLARMTFERDVGLDRFLDGLRTNAGRARDAGIISDATYRSIVASSPDWYAPLSERGIHDGDVMLYRIRGDTLHTVVRSADGQTLIDQTDVGAQRRLAVLGGYLAPGSDFRDGLIDSVLQR